MTARMNAKTFLWSVVAVLLAFVIPLGAVAQSEVKPVSTVDLSVHANQLDVVLYSSVETRVDNLSFSFADKELKTEKVQHYQSTTDGCSYLFIIDMPKMTSLNKRSALLDSYKKTLVYILGSMADEDNAAMIDTSAESVENIRFGERTSYFSNIEAMTYQETPNTLNAAIARGIDCLANVTNTALRRRTCLVVLTNGFGKSEEGQTTESLIEKVQKSNTTVYTIVFPTTTGKEDEIARLGDVAHASKGGCALTCEDSANDSTRELLFRTFSENENCFYQTDVSLDDLSSSDELSVLTVSISTKTDTLSDEYNLAREERTAVSDAISDDGKAKNTKDDKQDDEEEADSSVITILLVGGAVLLLIAIVLVVLAVSRAKKKAAIEPTVVKDEPTEEAGEPTVADINGIHRPHVRVVLSQSGLNESARYEADMLDSLIIGRDPKKARLLITNDPKVSAVHAKLTYDGSVMRLEDCNSTNGTRLNGVKITAPCVVQQGDEMTFGRSSLRIHWSKVS